LRNTGTVLRRMAVMLCSMDVHVRQAKGTSWYFMP
jgi:hypothetical protein